MTIQSSRLPRAREATEAFDFLSSSLVCASTSWSIGGFGAVAEFHHTAATTSRPLTICSESGAIRVFPVADVKLVAYEMLSARPACWHHGVLVCVPSAHAFECPGGLTELGPDEQAVRPGHRSGVLFDLGLGSPAFRFCVRLLEPEQIQFARRFIGQRVVETHGDLFQQLMRWSPHRVVMSPVARIEVYQRIASPDGKTPPGPHTHLIPHLLRPTLTHSSYMPVPAKHLVGLTAYPAHPAQDENGHPKAFDQSQHRSFQRLLSLYGNPDYVAAKARARSRLIECGAPDGEGPSGTRMQRNAWRIMVRQLPHELAVADSLHGSN